jgi:hypothetical protein
MMSQAYEPEYGTLSTSAQGHVFRFVCVRR